MEAKHLKTGQLGEKIAIHYLKKKGYRILKQNYTNTTGVRLGEIDIIASFQGRVIFVEVKTRITKTQETPLPEASISREKLRKLTRIANVYLSETSQKNSPYSFDAMSVVIDEKTGIAKVRHLQSIFL
jgi:putative endonuclease